MKGRLLLIDVETGGLDPNFNSILSLAALVLNYDGQVINRFYSLVDESDTHGFIVATEEALKINGLTRAQCKAEGLSPRMVVMNFVNFLRQHDMTESITLVGHNVAFDRSFLKRLFDRAFSGDAFDGMFSHRMICTQSSAGLLDQAGVIRLTSTSLDGVCKHFGITLDRSNGHHAMTDAEATAEVFRRLMLAARDGIHART